MNHFKQIFAPPPLPANGIGHRSSGELNERFERALEVLEDLQRKRDELRHKGSFKWNLTSELLASNIDTYRHLLATLLPHDGAIRKRALLLGTGALLDNHAMRYYGGDVNLITESAAVRSLVSCHGYYDELVETRLARAEDRRRCVVCQCDVKYGERVKVLPCHHGYHGDCISRWFTVDHRCPQCNYDMMKYLEDLFEVD